MRGMTQTITNTKRITQPASVPPVGAFAHVQNEDGTGYLKHDAFQYCRERFGKSPGDWRQILFVHPAGEGLNVAAFLARFETQMGHENLSECGPTNNGLVSWIKPAEFWTRNSMRKSLFTLLLRAAIGHDQGGAKSIPYDPKKDNFEESLYSMSYLKRTKTAVELFLTGHTWAKTHKDAGWVDTLENKAEPEVKKLIYLKPVTDKALLKFAAEQLGCATVEGLTKKYRAHRDKEKREQREKAKEKPVEAAVESKTVTKK